MKAVFYKNSGSKSDTKTYTQVRIQPDAGDSDWEGTNNGMSDTYYRVTTEENTWVILYQNKDFGGLEILIPPKSDYILSNYDFGATIVSSFKVTDYLPVDGNSIAFWTTPNYHGESLTMTTSGSLNQGLIDFRPGSLIVGANIYAYIHSKNDDAEYGSYLLLTPGQQIDDLNDIPQNIDGGDWNSDIETVKIYANPPVTGNVLVDPIEVVNQFLSNMGLSDSDKHSDPSRGYYYDFNTQGDDYKIRVPYFMPSSDGSQWNVVIQTQYGVTFSDPTGQISFSIDSQGNLNGTLTMDYDFSGPLSRVCSFSSGVITVSEDVAKVLVPAVEGNTADVLMALVNITDITALSPFMIADAISLGLSVTQEVIDDIKLKDMTPNYFYFPVITSHFFIRLMYAYNQKQYGNTPSNNITFNESAFMSSFNSISSIGNYSITGLDYSIDYSGSGMFVSFIFSCKPDKNNDSEKPKSPQDVTILAAFNCKKEIVAINTYYKNNTLCLMTPGVIYLDTGGNTQLLRTPGSCVQNVWGQPFWNTFDLTWTSCANLHELDCINLDASATLSSLKNAAPVIQDIMSAISNNMTFTSTNG